jgi:hypothetical protein
LNESIGEARGVHAFSGRRGALLALIPALSEGHFPLIWDTVMELSEPFRIDPLLALAQQRKFQAQRHVVLLAALECIKLIRDEYFAAEAALKLCELTTGTMCRRKLLSKAAGVLAGWFGIRVVRFIYGCFTLHLLFSGRSF